MVEWVRDERRRDQGKGLMMWVSEAKERWRESCEKPWVRDSERRRNREGAVRF